MKKFPKYQSDVWSIWPRSGRCHLGHCWEKEQMEMDTVPASSLACVFPFSVLRDPPQWPWRGSGTRTSLCTPGQPPQRRWNVLGNAPLCPALACCCQAGTGATVLQQHTGQECKQLNQILIN